MYELCSYICRGWYITIETTIISTPPRIYRKKIQNPTILQLLNRFSMAMNSTRFQSYAFAIRYSELAYQNPKLASLHEVRLQPSTATIRSE
jgi:hypothetical protein